MLKTFWYFINSFLFLLCLMPSISDAAVWDAKNQWDQSWEDKYSEWVKQNLSIHYFEKEGTPYSGMKLDCADVVYSMRTIFAFENKLPLAFKDYTGGKNKISNEMKRWDHQPEDKRIRSFLSYTFDMRGTEIMPEDTYPVAIDPKTIRAGTIILTGHESHHSWTIRDVNDYGLPHLIFSSRPAKTTILQKIGFPSYGFTFPAGNTAQSKAGFRYFRQPQYIGIPVWKVPGYSEDMYNLKASEWPRSVQKKLAKSNEEHDVRLERLLKESCDYARDRVNAVNEGIAFLINMQPSSCMDATKYDDFSTPNRDKRLQDLFSELDMAFSEAKLDRANLPSTLVLSLKSIQSSGDATASAYCPIEIAPGKTLSLSEIRKRSFKNLLSNNPHDPLENRWGYKSGHSTRAKKCPTY